MGAGDHTKYTTMYDIDAYLQFRKLRLTQEPFHAALTLAAKGKRITLEIELPEEATPEWHELYEHY
jgi:hypothetical protein